MTGRFDDGLRFGAASEKYYYRVDSGLLVETRDRSTAHADEFREYFDLNTNDPMGQAMGHFARDRRLPETWYGQGTVRCDCKIPLSRSTKI